MRSRSGPGNLPKFGARIAADECDQAWSLSADLGCG